MQLDLKTVIALDDSNMFKIMESLLTDYYGSVLTDGDNYIFAIGKSKTCFVAHLDTRRKSDLPINITEYLGCIYNSYGVLGADDRAGIFMIIKILEECIVNDYVFPSILITNYEESGMRGMKKFLVDDHFLLAEISLLLALDRTGYSNYVTYGYKPTKQLKKYINSYGFNRKISKNKNDIFILGEEYGVATVNLSIGYYREHTHFEHLRIGEFLKTLVQVIEMVKFPYEGII